MERPNPHRHRRLCFDHGGLSHSDSESKSVAAVDEEEEEEEGESAGPW